MQSSFNNKNGLHNLLAIAFCLSLSFAQSVFAQPVEENGGQMQGGMRGGQRWREKMMNMPPEKRELFMQRLRERRGPDFQPGQLNQPGQPGQLGQSGQPGQDNPERQFAQGQRGGLRKRGGGGGARQGFGFGGRALDLTQLNLSEKQRSDILALRAKHSEQAKSIQKNLRGKRMELRNMLFSPDLNRKSLQDKRAELRGLQNQMDDIMIDDFLGVRSVLSEEQIKKMAETNMPNAKRRTAEIQP
jgi:Spy/CpxP family protein refolding chaperone